MKWLIIIILILIIVGLWFIPQLTKPIITGAATSIKSFIGALGWMIFMKCKKCGSEDVNCIELNEKAAKALTKLGLNPNLHVFKKYQCNACGNIFEIRE